MTLLSIIIPVYKGEPFLGACLDSIYDADAPIDRFEVVVVDDGSPDGSKGVAEDYARRFLNLTVVSQPNKGLGEARNTGIRNSHGRYLWFVDQDDCLTPGAVKRVCGNVLEYDSDIIDFDFRVEGSPRFKAENRARPQIDYSGVEYLNTTLVENPVWHYALNRDFVKRERLSFHARNHEDSLFTPLAFFRARSVVYTGHQNYIYNYHDSSLSSTLAAREHCNDLLKVMRDLENVKLRHAHHASERKALSRYIILSLSGLYYYWKMLPAADQAVVSAQLPVRTTLRSLRQSGRWRYLAALLRIKLKQKG